MWLPGTYWSLNRIVSNWPTSASPATWKTRTITPVSCALMPNEHFRRCSADALLPGNACFFFKKLLATRVQLQGTGSHKALFCAAAESIGASGCVKCLRKSTSRFLKNVETAVTRKRSGNHVARSASIQTRSLEIKRLSVASLLLPFLARLSWQPVGARQLVVAAAVESFTVYRCSIERQAAHQVDGPGVDQFPPLHDRH